MFQKIIMLMLFVAGSISSLTADELSKSPRKIVFEEQQIEGKIRRPQLVLIKVEQRPAFSPMVMQSLEGGVSVVEFVSQSIINKSPYDNAFQFKGERISNYTP
jgi:hypothetical protein